MRFFWSLITFILVSSTFAQQRADHNQGLLLRPHLYNWRTVEIESYNINVETGKKNMWPVYVASLEMEVFNDGDKVAIMPTRLGCLAEIRFLRLSAAGSVNSEVINQTDWFCELSYLGDEKPRDGYFVLIEPGESIRFAESFRLIDESNKDNPWITKRQYDIFVSDAVWKTTHLKFRYRGVTAKGEDPDLLRNAAIRWKRYGVFPLNDDGEFSITSQPIPANIDWLKLEDRKQ
jgi:hypothetical protein